MRRAAGWQIWVPRVLLFVVLLLAAKYAAGLAVRSYVLRASRGAFDRGVHVGSARVSLASRQVVLNNVRISNPRPPGQKLLDADSCQFELAMGPLLRKQIVAKRGRVDGLRFELFTGDDTNRSSSETQLGQSIAWFSDNSDVVAEQWLAHLAERFKQNRAEQLESVKRTEAFCEAWATQSASLKARRCELGERVANLREAVQAAQSNPLRGEKFMADLPNTIADLERDFEKLSADLEKLPEQLDAERRAIVAGRRTDEGLAYSRLKVDPLEADALSAYLMRTQAARPLDELIGWLRWISEEAPADGAAPVRSADCTRGEDILFAGCARTPDVLIQAVALHGAARIANQSTELRGTITGLSTQLGFMREPLRIRLVATGAVPLELQAIIDRTRGAHRDALLMDCKGVLLPQMALGKSEQLALTLAPSVASLQASLSLDGEQLTGNIQLVQQNVRITPVARGELASVPLSEALQETLGHVDCLATRVTLGGTLSEPKCTLWSNVGPAVAEAIEQALDRATGQQVKAIVIDAGKRVDERLAMIEREMTEQQSGWRAQATDARDQMRAIAATQVPPGRLSPDRVGRRLPGNSLFR
jgi:uncharacterized protein (TIGR03545 family)